MLNNPDITHYRNLLQLHCVHYFWSVPGNTMSFGVIAALFLVSIVSLLCCVVWIWNMFPNSTHPLSNWFLYLFCLGLCVFLSCSVLSPQGQGIYLVRLTAKRLLMMFIEVDVYWSRCILAVKQTSVSNRRRHDNLIAILDYGLLQSQ